MIDEIFCDRLVMWKKLFYSNDPKKNNRKECMRIIFDVVEVEES